MQYTLKPCPVGVFGHGLDMSCALETLLLFKGFAVLIFYFLKRATLTERLEIDILFWAWRQSVLGLAAWMGVSPLSYRLLCHLVPFFIPSKLSASPDGENYLEAHFRSVYFYYLPANLPSLG